MFAPIKWTTVATSPATPPAPVPKPVPKLALTGGKDHPCRITEKSVPTRELKPRHIKHPNFDPVRLRETTLRITLVSSERIGHQCPGRGLRVPTDASLADLVRWIDDAFRMRIPEDTTYTFTTAQGYVHSGTFGDSRVSPFVSMEGDYRKRAFEDMVSQFSEPGPRCLADDVLLFYLTTEDMNLTIGSGESLVFSIKCERVIDRRHNSMMPCYYRGHSTFLVSKDIVVHRIRRGEVHKKSVMLRNVRRDVFERSTE